MFETESGDNYTYNVTAFIRRDCPSGEFSADGQTNSTGFCKECPIDHYQDSSKQIMCKSCKAGRTTMGKKGRSQEKACVLCPAGFDCTESWNEPCEKGYYCEEGGAKPIKCPEGKTTANSQSNSLQQCFCEDRNCNQGEFFNNQTCECEECRVGHFCSTKHNRKKCPRGHRCPEARMTTPEECPVDHFQHLEESSQCLPCPEESSTYSLTGMFDERSCLKCPTGGNCTKDAIISLIANNCSKPLIDTKPGYFRFPPLDHTKLDYNCSSSEEEVMFFECTANPTACTGNDASSKMPCDPKYTGALCQTCSVNYSLTAGNVCTECLNLAITIVLTVLAWLVLVLVMCFLIRSALNAKGEEKKLHTAIAKLLISHLQLLTMASLFPFDWPKSMDAFFASSYAVSTGVISPDCLLSAVTGWASPSFLRLFISAVTPVIFLLCLAFAWFCVWSCCFKLPASKARERFVISTIVVLFLFYVSLTVEAVRIFVCIDLNFKGTTIASFLQSDTRIRCMGDEHEIWVYLGGAMLLFYSIGIPTLSFLILFKHRKNLAEVKESLGFVFIAYTEKAYYWESIVMARKCFFAFVATGLRTVGVELQSLLGLLLLFLFFLLHNSVQPFREALMNKLESRSLITCTLTFFCGPLMFYLERQELQNQSEEWPNVLRQVVSVAIIVLNIVFVGNILHHLVRGKSKEDFKEMVSNMLRKLPCVSHKEEAKSDDSFFPDNNIEMNTFTSNPAFEE